MLIVLVNDALCVSKEMALLEGSGQSVQLVFREMVSIGLARRGQPKPATLSEVLKSVPSGGWG